MTRIVLDTHVALFAMSRPDKLGTTARELIVDPGNSVYFSSISTWEVALKHARHPEDMPIDAHDFLGYCLDSGYRELRLTSAQVCELASIDRGERLIHLDPFDRMLLCQARAEGMLLLTRDTKLLEYDDARIIDAH